VDGTNDKQKLSNLSLVTLTTYIVYTIFVIYEISLRVYITIDGYLDECKDNATCLVINNVTKGHEVRHGCSAIEEDENVTLHSCYKVSYKFNEALASAGGLLTIAKLILQVIPAVISVFYKIISLLDKLSTEANSSYKCNQHLFTSLQYFCHLMMFVLNIIIMPIFCIRMVKFPTAVDHRADQAIIHFDEKVWMLMSIATIGSVLVNILYQQKAAKYCDLMKNVNDNAQPFSRSDRGKECPSEAAGPEAARPEASTDETSDEEAGSETQKFISKKSMK